MRIALTHPLTPPGARDEAGFAGPETLDAIAGALERAGHEVERVDLGGPVARVASRLEALAPELVVHAARGGAREAFFPALFAALGLPFTGSSAAAVSLARDDALTRRVLTSHGLPTADPPHDPRATDLACCFVAGLGDDGLLPPLALSADGRARPADLPAATRGRVRSLVRRVVHALDLEDLARCDLRVSPSGELHVLAVDPLPDLGPASLLAAAAHLGGLDLGGLVDALVRSACRRHGLDARLDPPPRRPRRDALRVGLIFNLKRVDPAEDDAEAEFDSPRTIAAITDALEGLGHRVVPLEATVDLPRLLADAAPDVVFNIAEGQRGRGREAQVPALCELLGIPYSGSDPTTLALGLDKGLTKQILRAAGVDTAEWQVLITGREDLRSFRYPVIVKPNAEGMSKGITAASVVHDEAACRRAARALIERYGQPALVEEYIAGREFTVGLLGERRPRVLPPMEVLFVHPGEHPVYGFEEKQSFTPRVRLECPAQLTPAELRRVEKAALDTFAALECRDVGRVDLRMAPDGTVYVLELNPLPGLTPEFSDLCSIARVSGTDYRGLIAEILAGCVRRRGESRAAPPSDPVPELTVDPAPPSAAATREP